MSSLRTLLEWSNLLHVLPSGMEGFHNLWSPGMCVCLLPNVPRHLIWHVCPWLTRYHHHRLFFLIFYALSIIKSMSFCSQYYEIYKYRCFDSVLSSLLAPWGHLGRYCHHASLLIPNFLQRHWKQYFCFLHTIFVVEHVNVADRIESSVLYKWTFPSSIERLSW